MRPTAILILLLALVAPAVAQTPIILTGVQDGSYALIVKGGQVTLTPAILVTPGGVAPPTTPPTIPPIADPINLASLTATSAAEYAKIPNGTMKQVMGLTVATVYRRIATDLRSGSINVAQAAEHLASITAALPGEWAAWTAATNKTWNALQDKGLIASSETWAAASEAVADGVAPQGALESFAYDEDEFLDDPFVSVLINMLMDLLGKSDSPIAKWLPTILKIVAMFF